MIEKKTIADRLNDETERIKERIEGLLRRFSTFDVSGYADLIIDILSFRQELADFKRIRRNDVAKITHMLSEEFERTLSSFKRDYDLNYVSFKDVRTAVESASKDKIRDKSFIENQISFYDSCLDDLKSLHFDVKNRIDFEKGLI